MAKLKIKNITRANLKDSDLDAIEVLLQAAGNRDKNSFNNKCKEKFNNYKDFKEFIHKFPSSVFALNSDSDEIEHSVFLSYTIAAKTLFFKSHQQESRQQIFGRPEYNKESLKFIGFNKIRYKKNKNLYSLYL